MLNDGAELAMQLIPPHDADPEKIYGWRVKLAGVVIFMAGALTTHIALACGFLPMIFPGFASAGDLKNLAEIQQKMRVESLGDSLYNMKKDQCIALTTGNMQAAETQDQRIREKQDAYRQVNNGQRYDLPPCDLFASRR